MSTDIADVLIGEDLVNTISITDSHREEHEKIIMVYIFILQ